MISLYEGKEEAYTSDPEKLNPYITVTLSFGSSRHAQINALRFRNLTAMVNNGFPNATRVHFAWSGLYATVAFVALDPIQEGEEILYFYHSPAQCFQLWNLPYQELAQDRLFAYIEQLFQRYPQSENVLIDEITSLHNTDIVSQCTQIVKQLQQEQLERFRGQSIPLKIDISIAERFSTDYSEMATQYIDYQSRIDKLIYLLFHHKSLLLVFLNRKFSKQQIDQAYQHLSQLEIQKENIFDRITQLDDSSLEETISQIEQYFIPALHFTEKFNLYELVIENFSQKTLIDTLTLIQNQFKLEHQKET